MKVIAKYVAVGVLIAVGTLTAPVVYAQVNSELTQTINAGTLSTDIVDASGNSVATPTFALSSATAASSTETVTGVLGNDANRISVDNPGATTIWTLSIAPTTGETAVWSDGGTESYDFNGATANEGQLTLNPTAGTIVANTGAMTGITKGTSQTFSGATPVTLMSAGATAESVWNGYITGVGISQTIPAGQAAGSYTIDLTQTVVNS